MRDSRPLLVSLQPALNRWGLWFAAEVMTDLRYGRIPRSLVVMNEVTGDVTWVPEDQQGSRMVQVGGVILNWNYISVEMRTVIRNGRNVGMEGLDPQWREHTKLAFLVGTKVARFPGSIEAERFTLLPPEASDDDSAAAMEKP
jgi:hypothetical protein